MGRPGTFQKGTINNPKGRPKKDYILSEICKQHTPEVVEFMIKVLHGDVIKRNAKQTGAKGKKVRTEDTPSFQDRLRAGEWLVDRGWGKAATVLAGPDGVGPVQIIVNRGLPPDENG